MTTLPTDHITFSELPPAQGARAVIDLDAVAHNARRLAQIVQTPWMAVVKANAYGHGLGPVALTALQAGASWLGVAQLDEALHLRTILDAAGVARPDDVHSGATSTCPRILSWMAPVLNAQQARAPHSTLRQALAQQIDLSVSTRLQLAAVVAAVRARPPFAPARIHLKVDTGMSRAGALRADLPALAQAVSREQAAGMVHLVGLWSHLARADEADSAPTLLQLERFNQAQQVLADYGLTPRVRHLAATAGALWHPQTRLDLVRLGIGLYGLSPDPSRANSQQLGLRPAMCLQAPLMQVKRVPAGWGVSYGGTWVTPSARWLGLIPLGYSDGIPRAASGCGPVSVNGKRTTVVGRVCMDQIVVDLGAAVDEADRPLPAPAQEGDLAVLWGASNPDATAAPVPSVDEWAQVCGTINYEIVARLGERLNRCYCRSNA